MKRIAPKILLLLILTSVLAGCASPGLLGMPVVLSQGNDVTPTYVLAAADATPTPTPFRPLPPTPVILPTNTPTQTGTPPPTSTPTVTVTPTSELDGYIESPPLDQLPGQVNILLLGSDARGWSRTKRWFRTDTIMLLTLNWELGTANLLSFPRDLYINIPGHGQDRINTAYQYGGFDLLRETFKQNFGVQVDHYVIINFENFKRFVDELGGLEVNVETPLEDYRNGYWTTIPAGKVYMDADTVLWYARSRKTSNDFARNKRQQEVLQAIIDEVLTLNNIRRAPELFGIYKDSVTTSLEFKDILPMLPLAVKLTDTSRINHYFVGPKMTTGWITPGGAMVLLPNFDLIRKVIRKSQNLQ